MLGGSASSSGKWGLGAKSYTAPTEAQRRAEAQGRLARESERRQIHEIKHQEKHIWQNQELQREVRFFSVAPACSMAVPCVQSVSYRVEEAKRAARGHFRD